MFSGSGMGTGSLGCGSSVVDVQAPSVHSTQVSIYNCIIPCFLEVVMRWYLWEVEVQVVDVHAPSVHSLQVSIYNTV